MPKFNAQANVGGYTLSIEWENDLTVVQNAKHINDTALQLKQALELPNVVDLIMTIDVLDNRGVVDEQVNTIAVDTLKSGFKKQGGTGLWFYARSKGRDGVRLPADLVGDYCAAAGIPVPVLAGEFVHTPIQVALRRDGDKDVIAEILNHEHTA